MCLDRQHGVIDQLADGGLPGAGLQMGPSGLFRHPEDVFIQVFIGVFGRFKVFGQQGRLLGFKSNGDMFQEDQAMEVVSNPI